MSEIASVFDSVYISFYKGLGSISGAMIMGEKDFCDEARVWLRRFGGNLYTLLPYCMLLTLAMDLKEMLMVQMGEISRRGSSSRLDTGEGWAEDYTQRQFRNLKS